MNLSVSSESTHIILGKMFYKFLSTQGADCIVMVNVYLMKPHNDFMTIDKNSHYSQYNLCTFTYGDIKDNSSSKVTGIHSEKTYKSQRVTQKFLGRLGKSIAGAISHL